MSTSIAAKVGIGMVAFVVLAVVPLLEIVGLFVAARQGVWAFLIASVCPPVAIIDGFMQMLRWLS